MKTDSRSELILSMSTICFNMWDKITIFRKLHGVLILRSVLNGINISFLTL